MKNVQAKQALQKEKVYVYLDLAVNSLSVYFKFLYLIFKINYKLIKIFWK